MKVHNFTYNGFCGKTEDGYAAYTADFKEWTEDPGIAMCICSDGKERRIPTYALEGFNNDTYPTQDTRNRIGYIGPPCHS